jgi:hypothetical protein
MTTAAWLALAFLGGFAVAATFAVALVHILLGLYRDERTLVHSEREAWRNERRELINRVQHPNLVPTGVTRPPADPDELARKRRAARDFAQVGTIVPASTATNGDGDDLELP